MKQEDITSLSQFENNNEKIIINYFETLDFESIDFEPNYQVKQPIKNEEIVITYEKENKIRRRRHS